MSQQGYLKYMQGSGGGAGAGGYVYATTTGSGTPAEVSGVTGAIMVEIAEGAASTATVVLEGSMDSTFLNAYAVGYQQVDNTAAPARAVAAISVTANSKHVYQILDTYPFIRARISAIAGSVLARAYYVEM